MNREIKFRAWDKRKKVMRYGVDIKSSALGARACFESPSSELSFYSDKEDEELMQFTGLKDKNGKEIYEGDIFKYEKHNGYLLDSFVSSFIWGDEFGCFGYNVTVEILGELFSPLSIHDELQRDFLNHLEIIGNIYENPNLLTK